MTDEVKSKVLDLGADIVGITSVDRLEGQPEDISASSLLENVESVIVYGVHWPFGVVEAWDEQPFAYLHYGYGVPNSIVSRIGFEVAKFLEGEGFLTYPVTPTVYFKDLDYEDLRGEFSHRHAAFAAGLGEFGFSNNFLTPEYGPNQRLGSILTSVELEPDPMYDGPSLCNYPECTMCVDACPVNALKDESRSLEIGGREITYGQVEKLKCVAALFGLPPGTGGVIGEEIPKKDEEWEMDDLINYVYEVREKHPIDFELQNTTQHAIDWGDFCGKCVHACPVGEYPEK